MRYILNFYLFNNDFDSVNSFITKYRNDTKLQQVLNEDDYLQDRIKIIIHNKKESLKPVKKMGK